jgi:hypothetical protein
MKRYDGKLTPSTNPLNLNASERTRIWDLIKEGNDKGNMIIEMGEHLNFTSRNELKFKYNTVYLKKEIETEYNKIHDLNNFAQVVYPFNYPVNSYNHYKHLITEDFTNQEVYEPVSTKYNDIAFQGAEAVTLQLKYSNSYSKENVINISIKHKVRSGTHLDKNNEGRNYVRGKWGEMQRVQGLARPFTGGSGSFSNYYGYFFIPSEAKY